MTQQTTQQMNSTTITTFTTFNTMFFNALRFWKEIIGNLIIYGIPVLTCIYLTTNYGFPDVELFALNFTIATITCLVSIVLIKSSLTPPTSSTVPIYINFNYVEFACNMIPFVAFIVYLVTLFQTVYLFNNPI